MRVRRALRVLRLRYLGGLRPEERRYWVLVPVTGIAAGLIAAGWVLFLRIVETIGWGSSGSLGTAVEAASPAMRVAVPAFGGLVFVLGTFLWQRQGASLRGTAGIIATLLGGREPPRLARTLYDGAFSLTAVGTGASLGREGALIHSGAAFGSWLGRRFRLSEFHGKVLLAAGAAGGIAAAYDAPIGGAVFAMEVLLGTFALDLFGPIIISSVIATVIARELGAEPPYSVAQEFSQLPWELGLDVLLGTALGVVASLFIKVFSTLDSLFSWLRRAGRTAPLLVMAALGTAGIWFPELYGNGYDTVNRVLGSPLAPPLRLLLLLALMKLLFTALCRASGITGGLFTPSLFLGALLGNAFGLIAAALSPWPVSSPGAYALVGMGAILAGTIHAPITAVLMIFEMTGDYEIVLPLMSGAVAATLVSHVLVPGSIYTERLRRRGMPLPGDASPGWLEQPTVADMLEPDPETVDPRATLSEIIDRFLSAAVEHTRLYVVDEQRRFLGVISLHDIKRSFRDRARTPESRALDIVDRAFPAVYAADKASRALDLLAEINAERLPVLDDPETRRLIGAVSKRRLLAAYRAGNLAPPREAG